MKFRTSLLLLAAFACLPAGPALPDEEEGLAILAGKILTMADRTIDHGVSAGSSRRWGRGRRWRSPRATRGSTPPTSG